jgi:hypothetical protein
MDKSLQDNSLQDKTLRTYRRRQIVADKTLQQIRRTDKTLQRQNVAWTKGCKDKSLQGQNVARTNSRMDKKKKCKLFNHIRRIHSHLLDNVISIKLSLD